MQRHENKDKNKGKLEGAGAGTERVERVDGGVGRGAGKVGGGEDRAGERKGDKERTDIGSKDRTSRRSLQHQRRLSAVRMSSALLPSGRQIEIVRPGKLHRNPRS